MEAKQVYEIIKNVPREAWPKNLQWDELGFIGSMTMWLSSYGVEIRRQVHENSELRYTVMVSCGWQDTSVENPELIAALAIAVQWVTLAKEAK
jgi:hypothetical protein